MARTSVQSACVAMQNTVRALLREAGVKLRAAAPGHFAAKVREMASSDGALMRTVEPLLAVIDTLRRELACLTKEIHSLARGDATCRRMMTIHGVGPLTAVAYVATVDDPSRFRRSRDVGAHIGLTPRRYQSGETDVQGRISRCGDAMLRGLLYEAASSMLLRSSKWSALKAWGVTVAKRRGIKRATVAVARKLSTVMHRMWIEGTDFRFGKEGTAA